MGQVPPSHLLLLDLGEPQEASNPVNDKRLNKITIFFIILIYLVFSDGPSYKEDAAGKLQVDEVKQELKPIPIRNNEPSDVQKHIYDKDD